MIRKALLLELYSFKLTTWFINFGVWVQDVPQKIIKAVFYDNNKKKSIVGQVGYEINPWSTKIGYELLTS